jgi:flagellar hook-length control protein FliK
VKVAEKVVAPEAVVKDTARVQQAISAYAPAQSTDDVEAVAVEAETTTVDTKATAKDNAVRTLEVRSAAAQEQANNLARLLGSENRIQVQVNVNAAHTAKQAVADVSIYNIYAGYSAADAISLANGQFGQAEQSSAQAQPQTQTQTATPRANEALPQAAVLPQPAQAPSSPNAQTSAPARADSLAPVAVQASSSSGGAATANQNFSAFTQSGQSNAAQQTQQAAQPNPTERPAATAQHVIDQIKVNITKAAKAGLDRVTIQLKPVELGRIEIKLEMSEDHKVRVTVTADTKDTLSLLQTDSRTLERTLNDAGLRTDANNLHFNLRSESDAQSAEGQNGRGGKNGASNANEAAGEDLASSYDYAAAAYSRGGVDTFA